MTPWLEGERASFSNFFFWCTVSLRSGKYFHDIENIHIKAHNKAQVLKISKAHQCYWVVSWCEKCMFLYHVCVFSWYDRMFQAMSYLTLGMNIYQHSSQHTTIVSHPHREDLGDKITVFKILKSSAQFYFISLIKHRSKLLLREGVKITQKGGSSKPWLLKRTCTPP